MGLMKLKIIKIAFIFVVLNQLYFSAAAQSLTGIKGQRYSVIGVDELPRALIGVDDRDTEEEEEREEEAVQQQAGEEEAFAGYPRSCVDRQVMLWRGMQKRQERMYWKSGMMRMNVYR